MVMIVVGVRFTVWFFGIQSADIQVCGNCTVRSAVGFVSWHVSVHARWPHQCTADGTFGDCVCDTIGCVNDDIVGDEPVAELVSISKEDVSVECVRSVVALNDVGSTEFTPVEGVGRVPASGCFVDDGVHGGLVFPAVVGLISSLLLRAWCKVWIDPCP